MTTDDLHSAHYQDLSEYLPEKLNVHSVNAVQQQLYKAIEKSQSRAFLLNLSQNTYCDSAGVALFIRLKAWLQHQDKSLHLVHETDQILALSQFLKVDSLLFETAENKAH